MDNISLSTHVSYLSPVWPTRYTSPITWSVEFDGRRILKWVRIGAHREPMRRYVELPNDTFFISYVSEANLAGWCVHEWWPKGPKACYLETIGTVRPKKHFPTLPLKCLRK